MPIDDLYYELKPHSSNLGQLDHVAMIAGESPFVSANAEGDFVLARLGMQWLGGIFMRRFMMRCGFVRVFSYYSFSIVEPRIQVPYSTG